ncbi:MAG: sugar ABC transporter permease [Chloroflexota bacterium]|nr:sugar ABC transporter permease [Chloroflexota bacterium]
MKKSLLLRKNVVPYLFILPLVLFYLSFQLYPMIKEFQMSFFDWTFNPGKENIFVGWENYQHIFQDPKVKLALKNTLLYALITVPGQMILAMLVALLIDALPRGKGVFRVLYYLPVITSWVIASILVRFLFNFPKGIINYLLLDVFSLIDAPINWFGAPGTAFVAIDLLGIWKGIGWSMLIYLSALQGIPKELLEAAEVDGASPWRRFWSVKLPLLTPAISYTLILLTIGAMNVFLSVFLITGGGPQQKTEVFLSYLYHQAFEFFDFGYGAALSVVLAIGLLIVSILQYRFVGKPERLR